MQNQIYQLPPVRVTSHILNSLGSSLQVEYRIFVILLAFLLAPASALSQSCEPAVFEVAFGTGTTQKCGISQVGSSPGSRRHYYLKSSTTDSNYFHAVETLQEEPPGTDTRTGYIWKNYAETRDWRNITIPAGEGCRANIAAISSSAHTGAGEYTADRTGRSPSHFHCTAAMGANGIWGGDSDCANILWGLTSALTMETLVSQPDLLHQRGIADLTAGSTVGSCFLEHIVKLDEEYTDEQLKARIEAAMALSLDAAPLVKGKPAASSYIDATHVCGTLSKARYLVKLLETERNVEYTIEWDEITVEDNDPEKVNHIIRKRDGTGGEVTTEIKELNPPFSKKESGGTVKMYVTTPKITSKPKDPPNDNGGGPVGGGPNRTTPGKLNDSQTCASCTSGGDMPKVPTPTISLGNGLQGVSVGELYIPILSADSNLVSFENLQFSGNGGNGVTINRTATALNIQAPECQVFATKLTDEKYTIEFCPAGSTTPHTTWTIDNPDATGTTHDQLRLVSNSEGKLREYNYIFNPVTRSWKYLPYGNLSTIETLSSRYQEDGRDVREETTLVREQDTVVLKSKVKFKTFDWGEGLEESTLSPDTNPLRTKYSYYRTDEVSFTISGTLVPLRLIEYPDGSWEYFQYDSLGRRTYLYRGIGDALPPQVGAVPVDTDCTKLQYLYADQQVMAGSGDVETLKPFTPRATKTYYKGTQVAQTFHIVKQHEEQEIVCTAPATSYSAGTGYLRTTSTFYSSGENDGRLQSVEHPDGTMTFYTYEANTSGGTDYVVLTGRPNDAKTIIEDGQKHVMECGSIGELLSRRTYAIVPQQTPDVLVSSEAFEDFDDFNRAQTIRYLDGSFITRSYGCCGLTSSTDRYGVQTDYTRDAADRPNGEIRDGTTTTRILDAAGRVKKVTRTGGGTTVTLSETEYDLAGRVTTEVNAWGGPTTHVYEETRTTTTYPDAGVRVEERYRDGRLWKITGSSVFGVEYEYGLEGAEVFEKEIKLTSTGARTPEYTKTITDFAGRRSKKVISGQASHQWFYNTKGQLWKEQDPDHVITLYGYNGRGELATNAIDLDWDDAIDCAGSKDRITATHKSVSADAIVQTDTIVWKEGSSTGSLVKQLKARADGTESWDSVWREAGTPSTKATTHTLSPIPNRTTKKSTVTLVLPDLTSTVTTLWKEDVETVERLNSGNGRITKTTYEYNDHGQRYRILDERNGLVEFTFNAAGQALTESKNNPDGGPQLVTERTYDNLGRLASEVHADNKATQFRYYPNGLLRLTFGAGTYPAEYTYDYAGRLKTMTNWTRFNAGTEVGTGGARVTTWKYDDQGLLQKKCYADADRGEPSDIGPSYTYTPGGRLRMRTWARSGLGGAALQTIYVYGFDGQSTEQRHGDLVKVSYLNDPANTADVTYNYDRQGRRWHAIQGDTTTTLAYDDANNPLGEKHVGGLVGGFESAWAYNNELQKETLTATTGLGSYSTTYDYDASGRLFTVAHNGSLVTYQYHPSSMLVSDITMSHNAVTKLRTSKVFDTLNRLTSISSVQSKYPMPTSYGYRYTRSGLREKATLADGSYWDYGYDDLRQVTSGKRHWRDQTYVAGQQYEYNYDQIGNRTSALNGGDSAGNALRRTEYRADALNQYLNNPDSDTLDLAGLAPAAEPVSVNGVAASRQGAYFHKALSNPTGGPAYMDANVQTGSESSSGKVFFSGAGDKSFVSGTAATTLRNNYPAFVGMEILVGTKPLKVTSLGRMMFSGNVQTHNLKLVRASDGVDVPGGSVMLSMLGGEPGKFKYATLAAPVTLSANTSYYIVSRENLNGDFWLDFGTVANINSAAQVTKHIYGSGPGQWYGSVPGSCFGPLTFTFVEETVEPKKYDLDGNLTRDGRWDYTWDAENRLVKMQSLANAPSGSNRKFEFAYDYRSRRVWKKATNLDTSATTEHKFLYDDWNLLAQQRDGSRVQKYVWGTDLSGAFQGAGGIGGLLKVEDESGNAHFCAYDGNGNLTGLVEGGLGDASATYEYGPFGEVIRATGPMAKVNPFRFSTKYQDDETDLVYYGYRYYNAGTGRWISRDPIEERGGLNLLAFARNTPVTKVDRLGLEIFTNGGPPPPAPDYYACIQSYSLTSSTSEKDLSRDFTQWYERRFPNTSAHVVREFPNRINAALQKRCTMEKLPSIYFNNYGTGERPTPGFDGVDEGKFGDRPQTPWEASLVLGNYNIEIRDFVLTVCRTCSPCAKYRWTARIVVVDSLGLDPTNLGDPDDPKIIYEWEIISPAFPKRTAIVASWTVTGKGTCCEK